MTAPKMRLAPYRLLVFLTYGELNGVTPKGNGMVHFRSGPLSRRFQISYKDLWKQIQWLEQASYLEVIQREHGEALVRITPPAAFTYA